MNPENKAKLALYYEALFRMAEENPAWNSNINRLRRWDDEDRLWWIGRIEQQAAEGLPMAQKLVARALLIRMTK